MTVGWYRASFSVTLRTKKGDEMRIWLSRLLAAGLIVGGSLAVSSVSKGGSFRLTWTDEATVADIRAALAAHEITCRQLVQMYLDRIEAYDKKGPLLNAIVMVNPNALATADAVGIERVPHQPHQRGMLVVGEQPSDSSPRCRSEAIQAL